MNPPFTVTIRNAAHNFTVQAGETVLQAALRQCVPMPWGCGGGICGVCLGQIVSGQMHYPDGEPLALFEEDAAAGKGLFCVGVPCSDLVLDMPEMA
ncbi:MAG: hypothetical protein RI964_1374 [Pseudomonadota bacterium]